MKIGDRVKIKRHGAEGEIVFLFDPRTSAGEGGAIVDFGPDSPFEGRRVSFYRFEFDVVASKMTVAERQVKTCNIDQLYKEAGWGVRRAHQMAWVHACNPDCEFDNERFYREVKDARDEARVLSLALDALTDEIERERARVLSLAPEAPTDAVEREMGR